MITRTFTRTVADCMILNLESKKAENRDVILAEKMTEKEAEKLIRKNPKIAVNDGEMFVGVVGVTYDEKLYGMDENDFLKYATELDEHRKPIKKDE